MRTLRTKEAVLVDRSPVVGKAVRLLLVACGIVVALVIVDAFDASSRFGVSRAIVLWSGLVGVNVAAWKVWHLLVGRNAARGLRLLAGSLIINGLLAVEVPAFYHAIGRTDAAIDQRPFWYGIFVTLIIAFAKRLGQPTATELQTSEIEGGPTTIDIGRDHLGPSVAFPSGSAMLARAGIADMGDLLAIRAEDHYCRMLLRGGRSTLVHCRFRDAVAELPIELGAQVHRGTWVADRAVTCGRRDGRRWSLTLCDGTVVPISETSVALCRARGWLTNAALVK